MKKYYFVGNAHLDPVWMWRWQEGSAEAKATVRSALDRMKEYPDFKFVCSSASVYQWVADFDPGMSEEVKARVKEGRFIVVGGWHVQPDCNLPSGEGFARQSLYSQRYFYEHLGVTARTGYNVDSFGHNLMLPQILKKSGLDHYVFMRPGTHENAAPPSVFRWRSPDGTELPTYRIYECYCFNLKSLEELEGRLDELVNYLPEGSESGMFFYGVGNHGGGPTKQNIDLILESARMHPEREYIFSDVADYFAEIEKKLDTLPVYSDDLQHHASGCYSAVSHVKSLVRKSENELLAAESGNMIAAALVGKKYANAELEQAWKNVLFCHFHDVLGGCSIEDAYTDASYMLGESISVAERLKNSAFQTISWAIDTSDTEKGYPIVLFNTLPFEVEKTVCINKEVSAVDSPEGDAVPVQHVHSQTHATCARRDTVFRAKIPAMGYATYYIAEDGGRSIENPLRVWDTGMENEHLRVEFEKHTGYITSIFDKDGDRELINGYGAVPTVIDETGHDTWSHAKNFFTREIAVFVDACIRVVESGPVRVMLEVTSYYNKSTLKQYFSLSAESKTLDVAAEVDWHEHHKMLKIAYDTDTVSPKAYYEIPFGVIERPADGEEEPGYRWFALKDKDIACAIINSNKYSFSAKDNTMYLAVVRSPLYADHGQPADDRCHFTDQGTHRFDYSFMRAETESWSTTVREARKLNTPPEIVLENKHNGRLAANFSGIECSADNIQISAIKRAEDNKGTVLRLYETDGVGADVNIAGGILPAPLCAKVAPYSINTYYLRDGDTRWKEVLITEFDIE